MVVIYFFSMVSRQQHDDPRGAAKAKRPSMDQVGKLSSTLKKIATFGGVQPVARGRKPDTITEFYGKKATRVEEQAKKVEQVCEVS